jgi:hypothetical protein
VQSCLADGRIPENVSDFGLLRVKEINEIGRALTASSERVLSLTEVLENIREAVHGFFDFTVDPKAIPGYLRDQLVQAYMITSPGGDPLITTLGSPAFSAAIATLAEDDSRYARLLRMAPGTGKATRVGVLPLNISFDDFKKMLLKALATAGEISESGGAAPADTALAAYVIRVSPSEDAMALVAPEGYRGPTPNSIIHDLIVRELGAMDTVTILAAADTTLPAGLAFRRVTESVLKRDESSLVTMISSKIEPVIRKYDQLKSAEGKRRIDKKLFDAYQCNEMVELCKLVSADYRKAGETQSFSRFCDRLMGSVPPSLAADDVSFNLFATNAYQAVRAIGITLTT